MKMCDIPCSYNSLSNQELFINNIRLRKYLNYCQVIIMYYLNKNNILTFLLKKKQFNTGCKIINLFFNRNKKVLVICCKLCANLPSPNVCILIEKFLRKHLIPTLNSDHIFLYTFLKTIFYILRATLVQQVIQCTRLFLHYSNFNVLNV